MSDKDSRQSLPPAASAPAKRPRSAWLKAFLLYGFIVAFAGLCFVQFRSDIRQISLQPVLDARGVVAAVLCLSLLNYVLRGVRWHFYMARLGYTVTVGYAILTFVAGFAFTLSPAKAGEMVRARYYPGVPLSSVAAACFVERLIDLLVMTTLAISVSVVFPSARWLMWAAAAGIATGIVALVYLPWQSLKERLGPPREKAGAFRKAYVAIIETLGRSRALLTPGLLAVSFGLGFIAWGAEGVSLKLLAEMAPTVSIGWQEAVGIYAVAIAVGALSFLPAGLGSTEAVMAALLVAHGFKLPDALLITFVCRVTTLWFAIALGWAVMFVLRGYRMPERASA
jgi:uncharacterized protein (TIRG00374 family)